MSSRPPLPVSPEWRGNVEGWMCRVALMHHDPDNIVWEWFNEAAEGDEEALAWAMKTWEDIRRLTSTSLEVRLARLRRGEECT
jgi:hypothetical protein